MAYGFTGNRESADDLAQEVFVKIYRSLDKFGQRSEFGTWLYRIAVNHIKDHLRKTARRKEVPLREFEDTRIAADDSARRREEERNDDERRAAVFQALQALPPKYNVILTLRDVRGCSYEEIADVLKISPGTVDSRLHRARRLLRKKMAPYLARELAGSEGGGL